MAEEQRQSISIRIAGLAPIPLQIAPQAEPAYRDAEKLVNALWLKWRQKFGNNCSSEEVMARVAFQFARLYAEARAGNTAVETYLTGFEQRLNDLVIKI